MQHEEFHLDIILEDPTLTKFKWIQQLVPKYTGIFKGSVFKIINMPRGREAASHGNSNTQKVTLEKYVIK